MVMLTLCAITTSNLSSVSTRLAPTLQSLLVLCAIFLILPTYCSLQIINIDVLCESASLLGMTGIRKTLSTDLLMLLMWCHNWCST